ncbi:hypothetical protein OQI_29320, partial [Streptomyces pharetrae CZA14]
MRVPAAVVGGRCETRQSRQRDPSEEGEDAHHPFRRRRPELGRRRHPRHRGRRLLLRRSLRLALPAGG